MNIKERLIHNKKYWYILIGMCAVILLTIGIWFGNSQNQISETPVVSIVEENPKYKEWKERNADFYGWLKIDDTTIDFPVMYKDNEYYLNHNADHEEDIYGAPFIDARCNIIEGDTNLLIHGHSTLAGPSGKMFDDLLSYRDEAFYQEHKIIHFDTLTEPADYEIIMVIESRVMYQNETNYRYYNFIHVETKEEWQENIDALKELQLYETGVETAHGDQLITLSTCDYTRDNGRLAVIAKKV